MGSTRKFLRKNGVIIVIFCLHFSLGTIEYFAQKESELMCITYFTSAAMLFMFFVIRYFNCLKKI